MDQFKITEAQDRAAWLDARRTGLGGSDIAAVLGVSPYRTPASVYLDKIEGSTYEESEPAHWGKLLEDVVAKEFQQRTGMKVQRVNSILRAGEDGWMIANIDRAIVNPSIAKSVRLLTPQKQELTGRMLSTDVILECKTASQYLADQWGPSQEAEICAGESVSDYQIPCYYETQVQWYMGVTGARTAYVAVLIGGQDFRMYCVDRDDELIDGIRAICREFWEEHILKQVPPKPVNFADVKRLFPKENGEMIEASNDLATAIGEYRTLSAQIKDLTAKKDGYATQIAEAIGDAEGVLIGGEKAATFKSVTTRRFDSTRFKKSDPVVWAEYLTETTDRRLRVF